MLQAILVEPGKIELKESPLPEPSEEEVVIRIDTALTCGTDLKAFIRGHYLIPMPGPFGHEYSGVIAKIGKDVKGFKEGDAVMGVHSAPCLKCRYCRRGLFNLCEDIMETKALGAFAEYLLLPANVVKQNLYHKPSGLSFKEAALLEPLSCVIHPYNRINLALIQNALVIGTGAIGLMHLVYLMMKGITVLATDISMERLSIASGFGAEIITSQEEIKDAVMQKTDNLGVDLVVECTGQKDVWQKSVDYVRRGGMVILFGGCPQGSSVNYETHRLHYDELTLYGSFHYTPQDVRSAYEALTDRKLDLLPIISDELPLKNIEDAFRFLKEGRGIKYALKT